MGKLTIIGNANPVIGKLEMYSISAINNWLQPLSISSPLQTAKIQWGIFVQDKNGWRRAKHDKKGQIVPYIFGQKSLFHKAIKIVVQCGNDMGELLIHPQRAKEPKITRVELLDVNYNPIPKGKRLSYKDTIIARAHCVQMFKKSVSFTLWEDDAKGKGHDPVINALNKVNSIPLTGSVNQYGKADVVFRLPIYTMAVQIANAHIAAGDKNEGATHEYYVTAEVVDKKIMNASPNVNVANPTYGPTPTQPKPKPTLQQLPQQKKPAPKKPDPIPTKPKPHPDSAKFPQTPAAKKQADPEGKINSAEFTDGTGKTLKNAKIGDIVSIKIVTQNMKGKTVNIKIWQEDFSRYTNNLLYEKPAKLLYDTNFLNNVKLTKIYDNSYETGEGSSPEYFIEVIHNGVSVDSPLIPVTLDTPPTKPEPTRTTTSIKKNKIIFDKVTGLGEEAVIHITNEIATSIKVNKDGSILSYPDLGGYNGKEEYKEGNEIYCKKLSKSSVYPTYKAYIYRGKKVGEAIKKLKEDIDNNTHENAENTILEIARHVKKNNSTYDQYGIVPSSTIEKLHRLKYKTATNDSGKTSFRYRIVDSSSANFPILKDITNEVSNGSMTLGSRSSISIDPWKSKDLVGCLGIRGKGGENHPSCSEEMKDQSPSNYKNIYHSLNNYLESVIPELTGIYGRRGYSSNGKIGVLPSKYDHEIKVFVLIDTLPEFNDCKCNLKNDGRKEYYNSFGNKVINYVSSHTSANKYKGLYMIAQRRQENSFNLKTPLNNPMNIKGSGDAGKKTMSTHETYNGKYQSAIESFANFTSEDAGFNGYLELLKNNFPDAYNALTDNSKTIDDFVIGLEDTGKKGAYATGEEKDGITGTQQYKKAVKANFDSTLKDYKEMLKCQLCKEKDEKKKDNIKKDIELLNQLK